MKAFWSEFDRIFRRRKHSFHVKQSIIGVFKSTGSIIAIFWRYVSGEARRRAIIARLQKADIILASPGITTLSLIALGYRLFLRSRYVHSMLYIGEGKIIHTTARNGVVLNRIPRSIFRRERYAIYRVKGLDSGKRDRVIEAALNWRRKKLDFAGLITTIPSRLIGLRRPFLMWEKKRVWCSKLVYKAFSEAGINLVAPEKAENITSEDLSRSNLVEKI